mmetsp:Transcript_2035/g.3073  ORF Transcript_2035/g.3073 Transcript_2035/m.3073 type:complete len:95 (+) Transcript_2035:135-419(+)|eukprot:CAMPEP_0195514486 /NCGR_PEP_ID=MMETSP0794_2-20130614/5856_1 /TAXON_ID=515487 /ORGANISM="Stephanopyxis turris, Strain CCMP 815" /LENGTH=94 /DNA_ID=CAMNT_0040642741 /DNA_START=113 /DNA_END=397 /DNA_ORIENTATION=+
MKGPLISYKTYVYDISKNKGLDAFNNTTRKLSKYILSKVPNAGEFLKAMKPDNLGLEEIPLPNDPNKNASQVEYKKWKTNCKNWDPLTKKRTEA